MKKKRRKQSKKVYHPNRDTISFNLEQVSGRALFFPEPGFWERNFSDSSFDPRLLLGIGPPPCYGSREMEREELKGYKWMHSEVGKSLVLGKRKKGVRK